MSTRRIAGLHSADNEGEVDPRLVAASGGDVEHARRISDVLEQRRAAAQSAEVIRLPRLYPDDWLEPGAELESPPFRFSTGLAWAVAIGIGLAIWGLVAAIAYGGYRLYGWLG